MERIFRHEARVYDVCSPLEGIYIPRLWGGYILMDDERELPEDALINVLIFQQINGIRLPDSIPNKCTKLQKASICRQIEEIMKELNNNGVIWSCVCPDNFIIEEQTKRIVAYDFMGTIFCERGDPHYDRIIRTQNNEVSEFLKRLNFRSELEELGYLAL